MKIKDIALKTLRERNWPVFIKMDNRLSQVEAIIFDHKDNIIVLSADKSDSEIGYLQSKMEDTNGHSKT